MFNGIQNNRPPGNNIKKKFFFIFINILNDFKEFISLGRQEVKFDNNSLFY